MFYLRQSTTVTVSMGPAVSPADALTPYTAGGFTVYLSSAGGTFAARNDATAITHDRDGWYKVELNATDTGTVGRLRAEVVGSAGNYLPFWEDCEVLAQVVYDVLFGTVAPSTYAGGDTAGTTTLLTRVPGTVQPQTGDSYARIGAAGAGLTAVVLATPPPTAAAIATAVLTDAGDNTTTGTPGKILAQLAGAFTGTGSVFTTASLVNAPTGGSAPTVGQIATAVWQDTTAGDFTTAGSPGKLLISQLAGAFTGTSSVFTTASLVNAGGGGDPWLTALPGSYGAGTAGKLLGSGVPLNLGQTGLTPRDLSTVADSALTVGDALVSAICSAAGKESVVGTAYTVMTPSTGTVVRLFALNSSTAPSARA